MSPELTEATARANHAEPTSSTERIFAELLADVLRADRVTLDAHFFDDLGADSLLMAQFCARVRRRDDLPAVSIKDVYRHPTIRSLAAALPDDAAAPAEPPVPAPAEAAPPAGRWQHLLCGALQLLALAGYLYVAALVFARGYEWIEAGSGRSTSTCARSSRAV